jgi:hypothetical protein
MTTSPGAEAQGRSTVEPSGRRVRSFRSPRKRLSRPHPGRGPGWILLIVGLAGLVLPGLQGVLTLALSATFFSLTSAAFTKACAQPSGRGPGLASSRESARSLEHCLGRLDSADPAAQLDS